MCRGLCFNCRVSDEQRHEGSAHEHQNGLSTNARLCGVTLQVSQLRRNVLFFERRLGFRVFKRGLQRVTLGADTPFLCLEQRPRSPQSPLLPGHYGLGIELPSVMAFAALLLTLNASQLVIHALTETSYDMSVRIQTPDGYSLTFRTPKPGATHAYQHTSNSSPLDTDALWQSLSSMPVWTGLPLNSRLAFVELAHDSLRQAKTFFVHTLGLACVYASDFKQVFGSNAGREQIIVHHQVTKRLSPISLLSFTLDATGLQTLKRRLGDNKNGSDVQLDSPLGVSITMVRA